MANKTSLLLLALPVLSGALFLKGDRSGFSPATWVSTAGAMAVGRSNACAVLLPDGRVLIAGGESRLGALSSAETLEPSGRFRPAPAVSGAHAGAACALLADGTVVVAGGCVAAWLAALRTRWNCTIRRPTAGARGPR
jgi:hypothetical protein